jgi:hypothetical protein
MLNFLLCSRLPLSVLSTFLGLPTLNSLEVHGLHGMPGPDYGVDQTVFPFLHRFLDDLKNVPGARLRLRARIETLRLESPSIVARHLRELFDYIAGPLERIYIHTNRFRPLGDDIRGLEESIEHLVRGGAGGPKSIVLNIYQGAWRSGRYSIKGMNFFFNLKSIELVSSSLTIEEPLSVRGIRVLLPIISFIPKKVTSLRINAASGKWFSISKAYEVDDLFRGWLKHRQISGAELQVLILQGCPLALVPALKQLSKNIGIRIEVDMVGGKSRHTFCRSAVISRRGVEYSDYTGPDWNPAMGSLFETRRPTRQWPT